ncbi:MAG: hypothetical protein H0W30_00335 [Gemmatimonadaceae bacterium]|nr:hypothetical protein [Gemmatimonadaceae bacterium]
MREVTGKPVLLVASDAEPEIAERRRVWGTGGWLPPEARPPEDRETLDWLTLCRFLGWDSDLARVGSSGGLTFPALRYTRWIIIACEPDILGSEAVERVARLLEEEDILVVSRAASAGSGLADLAGVHRDSTRFTGRQIRWSGPGRLREWQCRQAVTAHGIRLNASAGVWATVGTAPAIAARRIGRGTIATLGFHPSRIRDEAGAGTALLKHLLTNGATAPVAWLDFEGTLVLRMDDPGGSQNVHLHSWSYPKMGNRKWTQIAAELRKRRGRLSVGYVAGWVDDGDAMRGTLFLDGNPASRVAGAVHPSPRVRYHDRAGHLPNTVHDYVAEFRGIQAIREAGLGDAELHGFTHVHPDTRRWASAPDRYENMTWYRELGHSAASAIAILSPEQHPVAAGARAIERDFGGRPTTLICPGDQWTLDVIERTLDEGLDLVSCYHLALRNEGRFCWTSHVCAPYLDAPSAHWFDAELPVVGYFHDRELALEGVSWMSKLLDAWESAGATCMIDFRELASVLGKRVHIEKRGATWHLAVTSSGTAPALVRALRVRVRFGHDESPPSVALSLDGCDAETRVDYQEGVGSIEVSALAASEADRSVSFTSDAIGRSHG